MEEQHCQLLQEDNKIMVIFQLVKFAKACCMLQHSDIPAGI